MKQYVDKETTKSICMERGQALIRNEMARKNCSQAQIARELGISAPTLSLFLKDRMLEISNIIRIAQRFNVSLDYLFGLTDMPNGSATTGWTTALNVEAGDRAELMQLAKKYPDTVRMILSNINGIADYLDTADAYRTYISAPTFDEQDLGCHSIDTSYQYRIGRLATELTEKAIKHGSKNLEKADRESVYKY